MKYSPRNILRSGAPTLITVLAAGCSFHVAHYQTRRAVIPVEESLDLMLTETIDDDQAKALADGFEVLIAAMKSLAAPEGGH